MTFSKWTNAFAAGFILPVGIWFYFLIFQKELTIVYPALSFPIGFVLYWFFVIRGKEE